MRQVGSLVALRGEEMAVAEPAWQAEAGVRAAYRRPVSRAAEDHPARLASHVTLMEHAGVPISIISKWAGHYDSAFTQKTYVHASEEDLQRGQAALARIHKLA